VLKRDQASLGAAWRSVAVELGMRSVAANERDASGTVAVDRSADSGGKVRVSGRCAAD
jgi:hypothetical protein